MIRSSWSSWLRAPRRTDKDAARRPVLERELLLRLQQHASQGDYTRLWERAAGIRAGSRGECPAQRTGSGTDFEDSRAYQPGDDVRAMNWRLMARTGAPHMKVFREELQPPLFVVVDRRCPMRFGTRTRIKAAQAANLAALCIFTALRQGAAIGGALLDRQIHWMPLRRGRVSAYRQLDDISAPCPACTWSGPGFDALLGTLAGHLQPGTSIVLLSDFFDLEDRPGPLAALAARHPVHAMQVLDPVEVTLPAAGRVQLQAVNGGAPLDIDTDTSAVRQHFEQAAGHYWQQRCRTLQTAGIAMERVLTDEDPRVAFDRLFARRQAAVPGVTV